MAPTVAAPRPLTPLTRVSLDDTQHADRELYSRILTHAGLGLALWSLLIVPLGRLGGVPYATLPAVLAIGTLALSTSIQPTRWFPIAGTTAITALVIAWLWF